MRGEVLSSIELILPPNVVEACYKLKRDLRARFQAVNKDEGTCSEITVHKQSDDSVKLFIAVVTIENAEPEVLDDAVVETSPQPVSKRGKGNLNFRGRDSRGRGGHIFTSPDHEEIKSDDEKYEKKEGENREENEFQQVGLRGRRGRRRGRGRGKRGWWKRRALEKETPITQETEDDQFQRGEEIKSQDQETEQGPKRKTELSNLDEEDEEKEVKKNRSEEEEIAHPRMTRRSIVNSDSGKNKKEDSPQKKPWPTKARLKQPPELSSEHYAEEESNTKIKSEEASQNEFSQEQCVTKKKLLHKLPPKKGFMRQGTALSRIWRQKKRKGGPGRRPRVLSGPHNSEEESKQPREEEKVNETKQQDKTELHDDEKNKQNDVVEKELQYDKEVEKDKETEEFIKKYAIVIETEQEVSIQQNDKTNDNDSESVCSKPKLQIDEENESSKSDKDTPNEKRKISTLLPQPLPRQTMQTPAAPSEEEGGGRSGSGQEVPSRPPRRPCYLPESKSTQQSSLKKPQQTVVLEESQLRLPQKKRHMMNLARTREFMKEEEDDEPRTTVEINDAGNTVIVVHSTPKTEGQDQDDWTVGAKEIVLAPGQDMEEGLMSLANAAQHEERMQTLKTDEDGVVVNSSKLIKQLMKIATGAETETIHHREGKRAYKREFKVQCKFCTVKVKDYGYLFRHVKKLHPDHPSKKSYLEEIRPLMRTPCPICGKLVSSISNISSHMKQCHASKDSAVNCPLCRKLYKTPVSLRQHLRQCHQPQQKRFYCKHCPASFTENRSLKEHINCTHETTQVFHCDECGKTFLTKGRLRRHRYIHGDFRHRCSYCSKGFHLKDNMNKHIEIVHEKHRGKRFQCQHCGKRFTVKGNMMQHVMGVHLKQFQYNCSVCKHGFRRKKDLLTHMEIHNGTGGTSSHAVMVAPYGSQLIDQYDNMQDEEDYEEQEGDTKEPEEDVEEQMEEAEDQEEEADEQEEDADEQEEDGEEQEDEQLTVEERLESLANGQSSDIQIPPEMLNNGEDERF